MTNVQSIPSPAILPEDRAHEADHPSSLLAKFGGRSSVYGVDRGATPAPGGGPLPGGVSPPKPGTGPAGGMRAGTLR